MPFKGDILPESERAGVEEGVESELCRIMYAEEDGEMMTREGELVKEFVMVDDGRRHQMV